VGVDAVALLSAAALLLGESLAGAVIAPHVLISAGTAELRPGVSGGL